MFTCPPCRPLQETKVKRTQSRAAWSKAWEESYRELKLPKTPQLDFSIPNNSCPSKLLIILLLFLVWEFSENLHRKLLRNTLSEQAFPLGAIGHSMVWLHMHTCACMCMHADSRGQPWVLHFRSLTLRQIDSLSGSFPIRLGWLVKKAKVCMSSPRHISTYHDVQIFYTDSGESTFSLGPWLNHHPSPSAGFIKWLLIFQGSFSRSNNPKLCPTKTFAQPLAEPHVAHWSTHLKTQFLKCGKSPALAPYFRTPIKILCSQ